MSVELVLAFLVLAFLLLNSAHLFSFLLFAFPEFEFVEFFALGVRLVRGIGFVEQLKQSSHLY